MTSDQYTPGAPTGIAPKFVRTGQWRGYANPVWRKGDKDDVTILYSCVERRKSYFLRAYFIRKGYRYEDLGDHVKEDVRFGKEHGNRMECNPMYFTSGALIRALKRIETETGLPKDDIVQRYVFLGGGGQCGPCRYGLYPHEYLKVVNDAGFKDFRILIMSSDIGETSGPKDAAFQFNLDFRINLAVSVMLADIVHIAECALRPYVADKAALAGLLERAEEILLAAFCSRLWWFKLPGALKRVGDMFAAVARIERKLPHIFVTGEFFANLAHNDGNYNLRRFIMDEGCEVYPGVFFQRILYDNWRRTQEALAGIKYAQTQAELTRWQRSLRKQRNSTRILSYMWKRFIKACAPERFGGRHELLDLDALAELGREFYHPEIFGGEGNLEVAEAIHYAGKLDGFISSKPFGCMPSSGVSDGVQAKITALYPDINFLSIETSGDNDVNILSRVSMLLFKAKQRVKQQEMAAIRALPEVRSPQSQATLPTPVQSKTA